MGGQVRSDQVPDLTQVSGSRSRCKGNFCSRSPLAIKVEIWLGDEDQPKKLNAHVWAWYQYLQAREP